MPTKSGTPAEMGIICRNSARANRFKKKANHLKNVQRRAELYREHKGSHMWQTRVQEWHQTLYALSHGTI